MSDTRPFKPDEGVTGDGFSAEFARQRGHTLYNIRDANGLTMAEAATLQAVADHTGLPFSVVGERARYVGRNIDSTLPFGRGPQERSPIELVFPAEYDILTGGRFSESLYDALGTLLQMRGVDRAYYQASHLWPPTGPSIDFYPRYERREVILRADLSSAIEPARKAALARHA